MHSGYIRAVLEEKYQMKFKHLTKESLASMDRIERIQLVNSLSGFKSANLVASVDADGNPNLAVFSSVIHLGSNPGLIGFIMRPPTVERHTYENILESGVYTINQVHAGIAENAHYTAVKFERGESEFEACGLSPQFLPDFNAPYVKESRLKMGMRLIKDIPIEPNGTRLIVGEVEHIYIEGNPQRDDQSIDLQVLDTVCISGVDQYHRVSDGERFPYPRREELPSFKTAQRRPDSVVYDEKSGGYNASLLPYASSIGGPAFQANDLTVWKNNSVGKVSAHFKTRFEEIKAEYKSMVDQFSWNEIVYSAKFSFEPVLGETYHLYARENEERFMSLIPPHSWKMNCVGSFQLNTDKMWMKIDSETEQNEDSSEL